MFSLLNQLPLAYYDHSYQITVVACMCWLSFLKANNMPYQPLTESYTKVFRLCQMGKNVLVLWDYGVQNISYLSNYEATK